MKKAYYQLEVDYDRNGEWGIEFGSHLRSEVENEQFDSYPDERTRVVRIEIEVEEETAGGDLTVLPSSLDELNEAISNHPLLTGYEINRGRLYHWVSGDGAFGDAAMWPSTSINQWRFDMCSIGQWFQAVLELGYESEGLYDEQDIQTWKASKGVK